MHVNATRKTHRCCSNQGTRVYVCLFYINHIGSQKFSDQQNEKASWFSRISYLLTSTGLYQSPNTLCQCAPRVLLCLGRIIRERFAWNAGALIFLGNSEPWRLTVPFFIAWIPPPIEKTSLPARKVLEGNTKKWCLACCPCTVQAQHGRSKAFSLIIFGIAMQTAHTTLPWFGLVALAQCKRNTGGAKPFH